MWIRSQDKKHLVQPTNINVERNFGGKNKYAIMCNVVGLSAVVLGAWPTEEEAIMEIDRMQAAIESNPSGTYQVR